ncbi:MAG: hypothetical protein RBR24_06925 [Candidatus Carbobacillus sp.]|nr:hypothetical protein [Candidatus Carbobacillus sp.]
MTAKETAKETAKDQEKTKYEKEQILNIFSGAVIDVARVVLEDGKMYAKEEARTLVEKALKRGVR